MNRKLKLALAGAAVVAAALALYVRSGAAPDDAGDAAHDEPIEAASPAPTTSHSSVGAGASMHPPQVDMADDPEGTLLLEGQVIDDDDVPVAGAEVRIDANPPREAITEADGSFAFEDLVGRTYAVTAVAGDDVGGPISHELTETSAPVIVRMRAGAAVRVTVRDGGGDPVAGADVSVRGGVERSAVAGGEGRALVRGVSAGYAIVTATADGYGPARKAIYVPEQPGAEVSVTVPLSAGAPIRGRVHTAGGDPVEGARVVAEDASKMFSLANPEHDGVVTGEDGRYEIPAVSAGDVRVVARHERHPPESSGLVAIDGERPVTGVDIELAPGAAIAGRVVDDGGAPVPWASVRAAPAHPIDFRGGTVRGATADEDGRFEIVGLDREPAKIVATSEGDASALVDVDLGARDRVDGLELVLDAPARIAGHVVDGAGEPVAEVHVVAAPDVWEDGAEAMGLRGSEQTTTDGGGRFELAGLPEGAYRIRADRAVPRWQGRGPTGVSARTGDEDVTITLEENGAVRGRVALDEGGAPAAFSVAVGGDVGTPFSASDSGSFEVRDVEPGTHTVLIRGPTFSRRTIRGVEVKPGEATDLGSLTLTRGRGVSGRVYDATGAPVAGATVVSGSQLLGDGKSLSGSLAAFGDQMGLRTVETDDRGYYEIVGIGDHRQSIAAEHDERGRSHGAAIPAGSGSHELDLELLPFGAVRGRATVGGSPRRGVTVMATGKTDADQHVMVTAAGDGSFVIERLAAGEHRITAMVGSGMGMTSQMESVDVVVPPDGEASVELDIEVGDIELEVAVAADDDTPLAASQVFLVEGVVSAETGDDLGRLFRDGGDASMSMSFVLGDRPATFQGVIPGRYSVCALPIAGDLEDPDVMRHLRERSDELPVHCRQREVEASPETQSIRLAVPAPPDLGGVSGSDLQGGGPA